MEHDFSKVHRRRAEGDHIVESLKSAWGDAVRVVQPAIEVLDQLDESIRAAHRDGLTPMGAATEGGMDIELVKHVMAGGSSLGYFARRVGELKEWKRQAERNG